jgi:hypothetical protein
LLNPEPKNPELKAKSEIHTSDVFKKNSQLKTKDSRGRREKAPKNKAVDDEDWEKYGTSAPGSENNRMS